jgi:hypothetical protein
MSAESAEPLALWLRASDLKVSQEILEAHPALLSDESFEQLQAFAAMEKAESPEHTGVFLKAAALAGSARRDGIAAAYGQIGDIFTNVDELVEIIDKQPPGDPRPDQIPVLEHALSLGERTTLSSFFRLPSRLGFAYLNNLDFERAVSMFRVSVERRDGAHQAAWNDQKYFLAVALAGLAPKLSEDANLQARIESVKWLLESGEAPLIGSLQRSVEIVAHHHFSQRDWKQATSLFSLALDRFEEIFATWSPMSREGVAGLVVGVPACLAFASLRANGDGCELLGSRALERSRLRALSLVQQREERLFLAGAVLPKDLYDRLAKASMRLTIAERSGAAAGTRPSETGFSDTDWERMKEDAGRLEELGEATGEYERICREVEEAYPGHLDSRESRQMPHAGKLLGAEEGLAYLAHTDLGAVAILWTNQGADGVVAQAWTDEELTTPAVQACLERRVRRFWRWKIEGLLHAQQGQGRLPEEVEVTIKSLDMPRSAISQLARACRGGKLKRLILVPCGYFTLLPLHATPVYLEMGGSPVPLADVVRVSYAHSVETWVLGRVRAQRSANSAPRAVVVSDPQPVPGSLSPLPCAEAEGKFVAEMFANLRGGQSVALRRESAKRSDVVAAIRKSSAPVTHVHFACHAFANIQEPKRSGLVLAGGEVATVYDFTDPAHGPAASLRLAVLAACQTAVVGVDLIDEAIGLPAAWCQMGAATVVASLWPMSDSATLAIMKKFYQLHLIDGLSPSDALWLTQRWLRGVPTWRQDFKEAGASHAAEQSDAREERLRSGSSSRAWDHAVYWAGFVVYGD